jgi:intein/homing endonuclease
MLVKYGNSKIIQASRTLSGLMPSSNRMLKRASKALESLDLDKDNNIYLRNRAISALELHGPNQNYDAFEYDELSQKYSTFIGNPISVDHIGTTKIGEVLVSDFIKAADFRFELDIPMLPLKDTIAVLSEKCSKENTFNHVLAYANANKLVRSSDRKILLEDVGRHLCLGGWVENIWAIDRKAADTHTPGLIDAILKNRIQDTSMGCHPAGTKVTLEGGTEKNIEDISVGDKVITHTGNTGVVKNTFKRNYTDGIYKINIRGLSDILMPTYEHPYYVIKKEQIVCKRSNAEYAKNTRCYPTSDGSNHEKVNCVKVKCSRSASLDNYFPEFVKTSELCVGDYVSYSFSDEVRPTQLSKSFFRLLGYYLAEGWVINNSMKPIRVEFSFHKDEKAYIQELICISEGLYGKTPIVRPHATSANAVVVIVYSQEMAADLFKHGSKYALHKKVSSEILYSSVENQLELIKTFIQGDGSTGNVGQLYLESASRILIQQIMWMLSRARILWSCQETTYPVNGIRKNTRNNTTTWKLRISNYESQAIKNNNDKYIDKDKLHVISYNFYYKNHLFFPIREITFDPNWSGEIYNFEVEGDNSYLVNNVAVHNCLVQASVCSVCGNVATGELPPEEDFCECIQRHKGSPLTINGFLVIPFEINRDFSFFEDSLILPFALGGKAGGEGADKDAHLLEVFAARKKKSYVELNPNPPGATSYVPTRYVMVGDTPDVVEKNREEFNEMKQDFVDDNQETVVESEFPEGTIVKIMLEGESVDAVVVEEKEDTVTVAVEGIEDPVEISIREINEVVQYPEDLDFERQMDINDVPSRERHPEKRAASKK